MTNEKVLQGPLSAVQFMAISHSYTQVRDRNKIMRNEEKTLGMVRGMTESWANRYINSRGPDKI